MAILQSATGTLVWGAALNPNCQVTASGPVATLDGVAEPRVVISCSAFGGGANASPCSSLGRLRIARYTLTGSFGGYAFDCDNVTYTLTGATSTTQPTAITARGVESGLDFVMETSNPTTDAYGRKQYDFALARAALPSVSPGGYGGGEDPILRR